MRDAAINTLCIALIAVLGVVVGISASARLHAFDFSRGYQTGYSAGLSSQKAADNLAARAGLCIYASLACRRATK